MADINRLQEDSNSYSFLHPNQYSTSSNPGQQPIQQVSGAGGGAITGGVTPSTSAANTSPQTSSGRYSNLKSYLDANQDFAPESGGLAGTMANNINGQKDNIAQNISKAQNVFDQNANQAASPFSNDRAVQNATFQAIVNPVAFSSDPTRVSQLQQMRDAQYVGPKDLSSLNGDANAYKLQNDISNYKTVADQTGTESGRFNLLNQMFGNNNYTQGQQKLDNLMLQANPSQVQRRSGVRNTADTLTRSFDAAQAHAQQTAQNLTNKAASVSSGVKQAFQGALGNMKDTATTAATAAQTAAAKLAQDVKNGTLTSDEAALLGIAGPMRLFGVSPGDYVSNPNAATAANVITPDQQARYGALSQLLGVPNTDFANPTVAGTYKGPFDQSGFNAAMTDKQKQFTDAAAAAMKQYNDALDQEYAWQQNWINFSKDGLPDNARTPFSLDAYKYQDPEAFVSDLLNYNPSEKFNPGSFIGNDIQNMQYVPVPQSKITLGLGAADNDTDFFNNFGMGGTHFAPGISAALADIINRYDLGHMLDKSGKVVDAPRTQGNVIYDPAAKVWNTQYPKLLHNGTPIRPIPLTLPPPPTTPDSAPQKNPFIHMGTPIRNYR